MVRKELIKIYSGKSMKSAVILFCHECNGYSAHLNDGISASWAKAGHDVSNCAVKQCPLYPYRLKSKIIPTEINWL